MVYDVLERSAPVAGAKHPHLRALLPRARQMMKPEMTSKEVIQLISSEVAQQLGPWPSTLDIFVFRVEEGWECLITPTDDPEDQKYRAAALKIGCAFEKMITLKE